MASAGCRKWAGGAVERSVAVILRAMMPNLPMPVSRIPRVADALSRASTAAPKGASMVVSRRSARSSRAAASMRTKSEGGRWCGAWGSVGMIVEKDDASRGGVTHWEEKDSHKKLARRCWRVGGRLKGVGVREHRARWKDGRREADGAGGWGGWVRDLADAVGGLAQSARAEAGDAESPGKQDRADSRQERKCRPGGRK